MKQHTIGRGPWLLRLPALLGLPALPGLLVLLACGAPERVERRTETTATPPSAVAVEGGQTPAADDNEPIGPNENTPAGPPGPMPECHVSCCSAAMLELQARTAAETDDPSIAQECCFCEEAS